MHTAIEVPIGTRFGHLTAIGEREYGNFVLFRCDCGREKRFLAKAVRAGNNSTCGYRCSLSRSLKAASKIRHGEAGSRNGKPTFEYGVWTGIRARCIGKTGHPYYSGMGVKMCDRWAESYAAFLEDVGRSPAPGYTLDRIDPFGDYTPENCRWATKLEQRHNRRWEIGPKATRGKR